MKSNESHEGSDFKFGIAERKKTELDSLKTQVLNAKYEVEKFKALVVALTEKVAYYQSNIANAEAGRTQSLNNKNLVAQIVRNVLDLNQQSEIAHKETIAAKIKTNIVSSDFKTVLDELIFNAGLINELSNLIIRKKAINPLIPDELIIEITKASKDASDAIALTLVALKSVFTSQESVIGSEAISMHEVDEAQFLYNTLTGTTETGRPINVQNTPLQLILEQAYTTAKGNFDQAQNSIENANKQLNIAQTKLHKAQTKLSSMQSGLAAANAAVLNL